MTPSCRWIGRNQPLITYKPVEFEKQPVEIQDLMKITHHLQEPKNIYLELLIKPNTYIWSVVGLLTPLK